MGSDDPERGEVQGPVDEAIQELGLTADGASGLDPVIGLVLGQLQEGGAVGEERRGPFAEVEASFVVFGEARTGRREAARRGVRRRREGSGTAGAVPFGLYTTNYGQDGTASSRDESPGGMAAFASPTTNDRSDAQGRQEQTNVGTLPPPALTLMTELCEARATAPTSAPRT